MNVTVKYAIALYFPYSSNQIVGWKPCIIILNLATARPLLEVLPNSISTKRQFRTDDAENMVIL